MNSRKIYLSTVSGVLVGLGSFLLLSEAITDKLLMPLSISLSLIAAMGLYAVAGNLRTRSARAGVGLVLFFGAICYGAQDGGANLPWAVLWAGFLYGAIDSLGKLAPEAAEA